MTPTESIWTLTDCDGENVKSPDGNTEVALIWMAFENEGRTFSVTVTGPAGMMNTDFIDACRAAAAKMLQSSGGDPAAFGARRVLESDLPPPGEKPN